MDGHQFEHPTSSAMHCGPQALSLSVKVFDMVIVWPPYFEIHVKYFLSLLCKRFKIKEYFLNLHKVDSDDHEAVQENW